jgi:hypothetical protein
MMEGIVSFHQFVTAVLAEKVPGIEDGRTALHELIFNGNTSMGLTSEFTSRIPMGLIGPMALTGTYFKGALVRTPDGKLSLSDSLKDLLKNLREVQRKELNRRGICPMATLFSRKTSAMNAIAMNTTATDSPNDTHPQANDKVTGLQLVAEAYWKVFDEVDRADQESGL